MGETVVLECASPIGRPDPVITWEKDGRPVNTGEGTRFGITGGSNLIIESVEMGDAGDYVCVANNPAKKRKSKAATVSVL